jgi:hypothetical protein
MDPATSGSAARLTPSEREASGLLLWQGAHVGLTLDDKDNPFADIGAMIRRAF